MQQVTAENSQKDILVLIDFRTALLPFGSWVPVRTILDDISKSGVPVIAANHPGYLPPIFVCLQKEGFHEFQKKATEKKPTLIISPDGSSARTQITQIMIDKFIEKYGPGRANHSWSDNPKDAYPNVVILPEHDGFPSVDGFKIAAAEHGYPLAQTVYIAAGYYREGLEKAREAGAYPLVADSRTNGENKRVVLYSSLRPKVEPKTFAEAIKDMAVPA